RLVDDFMTGKTSWKWNISNSCVLEYEEVLLREGVSSPVVEAFLGDLLVRATRIRIPRNFRPLAVDPDDDIFAELAMAANADCVVTFNVRDLLPVTRFGIAVVTPAEFYRII
ncbi:MAG: PIN domain-containing protein, partial [Terrimicrobiaceae bacterium]|nr:PIN domain-containing protein [Terrimicrobiaceae bacterium]